MPLQPSYSRRLTWTVGGQDDSTRDRDLGQADRVIRPTLVREPRGRNGSASLIAGLVVVAAVGAGAIIFPERIAALWRSPDWIEPPVGTSSVADGKSPAALATSALVEPANAKSRPPQAGAEAARMPEPMIVQALDHPTTTSSIRSLSERPSEPTVEPQPAERIKPTVAPAIVKVEAGPQRSEPPAPVKPALPTLSEAPPVTPPRAPYESGRANLADVVEMLKRARALVARGDIAGARLLLERAASANDPRAIMALAETYDPTMLARWGAFGIKADLAKARQLYERAADTGSAEARARILALR